MIILSIYPAFGGQCSSLGSHKSCPRLNSVDYEAPRPGAVVSSRRVAEMAQIPEYTLRSHRQPARTLLTRRRSGDPGRGQYGRTPPTPTKVSGGPIDICIVMF